MPAKRARVEEYGCPDEAEHHGLLGPAEGLEQPIELGFRTGSLEVDEQDAAGPLEQVAVDLPEVVGRRARPDERAVGLHEHPRQPREPLDRRVEADRDGLREGFLTHGEDRPLAPLVGVPAAAGGIVGAAVEHRLERVEDGLRRPVHAGHEASRLSRTQAA